MMRSPLPIRFVETSIYRQIADVVDLALTLKRAVSIIGPPGIGKTAALEAIARGDENAVLLRVSKAHGTFKAAMTAIADAFGIWTNEQHSEQIYRSIDMRMQRNHFYQHYLLIDEAQQLDLNALFEIVDFSERYGLPVIVCGNPDLLKRSKAAGAAFSQITSRYAATVRLTVPLDSDFQQIGVEFNVYGVDAYKAVCSYGKAHSIRELVAVLTIAQCFAERGPITIDAFRLAVTRRHGSAAALVKLASA